MKNIEKTKRTLGYILIAPAVFSVLIFFIDFFAGLIASGDGLLTISFEYCEAWLGDYSRDGGGYSSALPLYFGLMAIAGAILLFNTKKPD